ncbi:oxidoreductase C-terminal domain-containing protein [Saccharopolyspora dendranthemae]|uniref:NAD/ferredoxin-dependent reductase-like protein n=1 Tax=Saccharopolyspora dendranthemae TaxID=1181886 RepID=A0A561V7Q6_9PSEU|nr:oxidoreductase C-terminal domain-containing protein [Saccharopolyspora dendranthemae]TWG07656.1 NAD/ferredoxin-dependent reductase-like protein [Saccharopolyspora dendranthemae]
MFTDREPHSRVQFAGVAHADEIVVSEDDSDEKGFLGLYRRGDRLVGALGVNRRRSTARLRSAISQGISWSDALASVRQDQPALTTRSPAS